MPLSNKLEDWRQDDFEGSNDERKIFENVFFGNDISGISKKCLDTGANNFEHQYSEHQVPDDDYNLNAKRIKLFVDIASHSIPDSENVLNSFSSPTETLTGTSCPAFDDCKDQSRRCFLVESSSQGVTSRCYLSKRHLELQKGVCKTVATHVSPESFTSECLVAYLPDTDNTPPGSPLCADKRLNKHGALDVDFLNKFMSDKSVNDPRPLLYNHVSCLLEAAGWHIEKHKTNPWMKSVFRSPEGKPFSELSKAWQICGQSLLNDKVNTVKVNTGKCWVGIAEYWSDLSTAFKNIEKVMTQPENTSALAQRWIFLDPFVTVVFIEKKIGVLRKGKIVETRGSLMIEENVNDDLICGLKDAGRIVCHSKYIKTEGYVPPVVSESDLTVFEGNQGEQFIDSHSNVKRRGRAKKFRVSNDASQKEDKAKISCNQTKERDLLVSAVKRNKSVTPSKKSMTLKAKYCKSKGRRKLKSRKGNPKLLPRSVGKSGKPPVTFGLRTVLSWLIGAGVVALNDVIQYRNLKDDTVVKDGFVTQDGIVCSCCSDLLSLSEFKLHAGFKLNRPCLNLFMESGMPYTLCQLQAWSAEYKKRKGGKPTVEVEEEDQNDDTCGLCGDGGELVCCDNCPATFHQACLPSQDFPDGSWFCSNCTCRICGDLVIDNEASTSVTALKCLQCRHKYHAACLKGSGINERFVPDSWFCGQGCQEVYSGLHFRVGLVNLIADSFSWTLLKCMHDDQKVPTAQWLALKAECNSKLTIALSIMEECFSAMLDPRTGIDMIPHLLYNWGSDFARLDFNGFYTMVLEKDDVLVCAACIRFHGVRVAEMPLIATCSKFRRQGMCRYLMTALEEMLKTLKVETLVISAIPHLVDTWTVGFGFELLQDAEKETLKNTNLMVFPGTVMLKKTLYENQLMDEQADTDTNEPPPGFEETTEIMPGLQSEQTPEENGHDEIAIKVHDRDIVQVGEEHSLEKQFLSVSCEESVTKVDGTTQLELIPHIQSAQNYVYDERKLLITKQSEQATILACQVDIS